jgi:hypothetical protein
LYNSKKYGVFEVYDSNILEYIKFYYNKFSNIEECTRESIYIEKNYKENRTKYIDFLNITYSSIGDLSFTCRINKYIIQDKIGKYKTPDIIEFYLNKKSSPYYQGDNDFYWFHLPDMNTFYLIPEEILIDNEYISNSNQIGKSCIYFGFTNPENYKTSWALPYKFTYNNLDKDKLLKLLNI